MKNGWPERQPYQDQQSMKCSDVHAQNIQVEENRVWTIWMTCDTSQEHNLRDIMKQQKKKKNMDEDGISCFTGFQYIL